MTRLRWLASLAALSLVLGACTSSSPSPGGGGGAASGGPSASAQALNPSGNIFVFGFSYKSTDDTIARTRVEKVNQDYGDLKVKFSESDFDTQPFLTALQSNDKPDVVRIPRDRIGSYISRGALEPMTDCVNRAGVDTSIYRKAAMDQLTSDGTLYALPDFYDTAIWMVDNKLWQDAGLDPASFDWGNWDQLKAANQKLLKGQGANLERIGIDPKVSGDYSFFSLWVYASGGKLLSDDGKESLLDTPEVANALTFAKAIYDAHGGISPFLDFRGNVDKNGDFFGSENQFTKHTEAAFPQQEWYLNVLAENTPKADLTFTPFQTTDGQPITFQEGTGWAIVKGTDNFDGACAFITDMVATDTWVAAAQARKQERDKDKLPFTGTFTGNSEADDQIFGQMVDLSKTPVFEKGVQAVLDAQDHAFSVPASPAGEEFRQIVLDAIDQALQGGDVTQILQKADQDAQDAIDNAGI